MNDEIWMSIIGFSRYEVSNMGRVRTIYKDAKNHDCKIIKPWINNKGYEIVGLQNDGKSNRRLVHRIVCEAFNGIPPKDGYEVAHCDGTTRNNKSDNLRWATRAENMSDCVIHGTKATGSRHGRSTKPQKTPRGEKHGHAKLSENDVICIRHAKEEAGRSLACRYGVSPTTISLIRSRKIWVHI